jgi:hypothetical protein
MHIGASSGGKRLKPIDLQVRFLGGEAKQNRLDFYDGSESLFGFSKTIKLAAHYLFTGKVRFQAPLAQGVKLFMLPAATGSYKQPILVEFDGDEIVINGKKVKVSSEVFNDFIAQAIGTTVGNDFDPQTEEVNTIFTARPGDMVALNEALDGPTKQAHRFIGKVRSHKKTMLEPYGIADEKLAAFDGDTLEYLITRIISDNVEIVEGTVASYHSASSSGRIYVPNLERQVPFKPDKGVAIRDTTPLTWSMDQREHGLPGRIQMRVRTVQTMSGVVKGFLMRGCDRK